ncbi:Vitamin D 25-hydroxylase [Orchesella cincta]|uniref:Vitamin D 25-hydroxylase n=1 Tax=Orchesella cincta TaxID=48709 RepID=A0A1D2M8V0_ORCCI|nr:Vitamin D 25-hydroxylase [Orchesella cincta]
MLKPIDSPLIEGLPDCRLPYTEAVLLETLRLSSFFALGVPHRMIADTEFHGYFLPKGVTVISNLYRFLNEDETFVIHREAFMPFSTGRRQCLGKSLAMDAIFLFLTDILPKFNIAHDPNQPVLNIETNV